MTAKDILFSLGDVDEGLAARAEGYPRRRRLGRALGLTAACAAVFAAFAVGIFALPRTQPDGAQTGGLPTLSAGFESGGMGFSGVMYYDISERENGNPWTPDAALETLPVYKNLAYADLSGISVYLSEDEMLALAQEAAGVLGIEILSHEIERVSLISQPVDTPLKGGEASRVEAVCEGCEITVYGNGSVRIEFDEPIPLPEGYDFTRPEGTTQAEALRSLEYLHGEYSGLLELTEPVLVTHLGSRSIYGETYRSYFVYDGAGSLAERIVGYYFRTLSFQPDFYGGSALTWINFKDLYKSTEKVGDYPIITMDEAREMLLGGDFITNVPDYYLEGGTYSRNTETMEAAWTAGSITGENIADVELIYRVNGGDEYFMPYYLFYVELTSGVLTMGKDAGLKHYGLYWVPAVSGEYLSDFPVYDGHIN